jgi:phosphonate transport system substrate-binding protein
MTSFSRRHHPGRFRVPNGLAAAALAVALVAAPGAVPGAGAAECENPDALRFSIIPTEETIQELTLYKPVIDMLAKNTGKKIEFYMPTSYASVVEAMIGGWVDVGVHGPNSYVLAREKDPTIEVFATYAKRPGYLQEEGPGYRAALITRKDSKFNTIESLKGATIGLTDPASTSGSLIPRVLFR